MRVARRARQRGGGRGAGGGRGRPGLQRRRRGGFPAHDLNQYPLYAEHALLPQQALVHYPDMLSASEAAIHYTPMLVSYFAWSNWLSWSPVSTC